MPCVFPPLTQRQAPRVLRGGTQRGFTLIEMMTTVVVAAVLLAVAAPGLASFVRSSRVNAAQSELVSSLMLARSEAGKRGTEVRLIGLSGTSDYSGGWLVGIDADDDGSIDGTTGSVEVIRRYAGPGGGVTLMASQPIVSFAPTGFLTPAAPVSFDVNGGVAGDRRACITLQPVGLADIQWLNDLCP